MSYGILVGNKVHLKTYKENAGNSRNVLSFRKLSNKDARIIAEGCKIVDERSKKEDWKKSWTLKMGKKKIELKIDQKEIGAEMYYSNYEKNWKPDLHTIPKKKISKSTKKSKRNIILLFIVCLYVESIIVCAKGTIKNGTEKTKYGEYIYEDGALMAVRRNNYGILAKNVNECKVSTGGYGSSVFVKKSGKKNYVYEIGLKRNLFPKHIISQKAAEFYPIGNERIILADKNKKFIYRGEGRCFFLYTHKTEKECVASSGFCKKEKVLKGVKKVWADNGGVAYVKDNKLFFAFSQPAVGCYDDKRAGVYSGFDGRGNQIKKVVAPHYGGPVFVLMKDGSLWGMGDNSTKLISNDKTKYRAEFHSLQIKDIIDIDTNGVNAAAIKKNGELWVWGKSLKNKNKYMNKPQKIARDVKEVSIGTNTHGKDKSIILYLKKGGKAYGLGGNRGYGSYMLTNKCKKKWIDKPVLLTGNIKHIYAATDMSLLLNKRKELLWTGIFSSPIII